MDCDPICRRSANFGSSSESGSITASTSIACNTSSIAVNAGTVASHAVAPTPACFELTELSNQVVTIHTVEVVGSHWALGMRMIGPSLVRSVVQDDVEPVCLREPEHYLADAGQRIV